jgi:hypothetical protein
LPLRRARCSEVKLMPVHCILCPTIHSRRERVQLLGVHLPQPDRQRPMRDVQHTRPRFGHRRYQSFIDTVADGLKWWALTAVSGSR